MLGVFILETVWLENSRRPIGRRVTGHPSSYWSQAIFLFILHTYPPMKMEHSAPKRRHIKFRRRGITQKKAYNNKVAVYIPWPICKHMRLRVPDKYCQHIPERVIHVNGTTFMWDVPAITDRTVLANRSDRKEKTRLLIDITTPDESNVNTKETEQLNKCKDLEIEASRMWKVRTKIVPVTNGALGTMNKGLDQNPQSFPAQPSAIELQKITLMSTAHCICKVWGKSL